ncbi:hypothetical protein K6L05_00160 [Salinicoccus roseus]|uniref:hypothetical protein n=1 Tax=Salinicoccus roseus TaxID=45670 RepID=UPI001CA5F9FE|nr:hypothetical protein [Salinicoccus roseus]MBY8908198.1 hypothetical protein [Salinicoccus roseus]
MIKVVINEVVVERNEADVPSGYKTVDYQEEVVLEHLPNVGDQILAPSKKTFIVRKIAHMAQQEGNEAYTMVFGDRV